MARHRKSGKRVVAVLLFLGVASGPGCRRSRLLPRPDGAVVVVAPDSTAEAGVIVAIEVEPNDLLANAQALNLAISPAMGIVGHLVSPPGSRAKDVDLYRIIVPPPAVVVAGADGAAPPPRQILVVSVVPDPTLVISIDALDDQGKILVAASGAAAGEVEGIPNLAVIPGTYFVRVKPGPAGSGPAQAGAGGAPGAANGSRLGGPSAADRVAHEGRRRLVGLCHRRRPGADAGAG